MSFFAQLPLELCSLIIYQTIPESFENIALTSKWVYELCNPFKAEYKKLTTSFRDFVYDRESDPPFTRHRIRSAFELISKIARNPVIARYIQNANFSADSAWLSLTTYASRVLDARDKILVQELLVKSSYLKDAGIDPRRYHHLIQQPICEDLDTFDDEEFPQRRPFTRIYSQHAATFLLTLLPNLRHLVLPLGWTSIPASEKLLEAITVKSKAIQSLAPSLGQLETLECRYKHGFQWQTPSAHLAKAIELLCPTNVDSFHGQGYYLPPIWDFQIPLCVSLNCLDLTNCILSHTAISRLLVRMPVLTCFRYLHKLPGLELRTISGCPWDWNVSLFLKAIEQSAGKTLVDLEVSDLITRSRDSRLRASRAIRDDITAEAGVISMNGFLCLQDLEFPLELFSAFTKEDMDEPKVGPVPVSIYIPASVLRLSISFDGTLSHQLSLGRLLRDLVHGVMVERVALKEICIFCGGAVITKSENDFAIQSKDLLDVGVVVNWKRR